MIRRKIIQHEKKGMEENKEYGKTRKGKKMKRKKT